MNRRKQPAINAQRATTVGLWGGRDALRDEQKIALELPETTVPPGARCSSVRDYRSATAIVRSTPETVSI